MVANWDGTAETFPSVSQKPLRLWKQTMYVPLKNLMKLVPEMKKKIVGFRAFFEKAVFWENGRGRHQTRATTIQYMSIFSEFQWGSPSESFIQKYWLVSIFKNTDFLKEALKTNNLIFFFILFLVAIS